MSQKIVPNIWYNGNAQEAAEFYCSLLPETTSHVEMTYPLEGLADFQRPLAGQALLISLTVCGTRLAMINAGPELGPNPSISFTLNFHQKYCDTAEQAPETQLRAAWESLKEGGKILMDLGSYPFNPLYGWVQDRYGVSWQLGLSDEEEPVAFVTPTLLFSGAAQNRAAQAIEFYCALFDQSEVAFKVPYTDLQDPVVEGSLMYSSLYLAGQQFAAMDSGVEQDFTFSSGVSLEVHCEDQAEIDRLWIALSAHPDEEQCGWVRDRFGVSWQIVPAQMGELMERPGAFAKLMNMKKIIISEF